MRPLDASPPFYWAPEVIYDNGRFCLYYSTGNEILMEIRVAVSDRPDGGFIDAGVRLTHEEFAIDAHVFVDDDGTRYFFYATDFLEYKHIGTGTVVDRMIDWKTLEGRPRPVTRAKYDWQVYDPARKEKGGVRWYTVEGPTILKRKGRYYEMFSGGNWKNNTYGVSFASTDDIHDESEWQQFCDGEKILPVLRTIPDKVIGPGHNSVIRGPNNRELYCVYHRWTDAGRVMAVDRMDFAGRRMFVAGPTTTPQPMPFRPTGSIVSGDHAGTWIREGDAYVSSSEGECALPLSIGEGSFLCEATIRFIGWTANSRAGLRIESSDVTPEFSINPERRFARIRSDDEERTTELAADFDPSAPHLLRIEVRGSRCKITVDKTAVSDVVDVAGEVTGLQLFSDNAAVEFAAIELTYGFEELFERSDKVPPELEIRGGTAKCGDGQMLLSANGDIRVLASFDIPYTDFEVATNMAPLGEGEYGVLFLEGNDEIVGRMSTAFGKHKVLFEMAGTKLETELHEFDRREFKQFRVVCRDGKAIAYLDGTELGERECSAGLATAAIFADGGIAVEMIRLTDISAR
jgi:hypothetical protein